MSLGHHKSTIWIWCAATQSHKETEKVHKTSVVKDEVSFYTKHNCLD